MKYLITIVFLLVSLTTFAKDNFKLTGKIDDAGNDTLCIEYVILTEKRNGETEDFYHYLDATL